jgi:cell division protein FtsL
MMRNLLRRVNVSVRQSAVLAGVAFAFMLVLALLWLSMSTRTAVLNSGIEDLDAKRLEQEDLINQRWKLLGEISAPDQMAQRAQDMGFEPVKVEYLVLGTGAATATVVTTGTVPVAP